MRGDPKIRAGMVHDGRRRVKKIKEHAQLNADEDCRKGNSDERHGETDSIVDEVSPSDEKRQTRTRPRNAAASAKLSRGEDNFFS
jgi:hypothetical protein